MSKDAKEYFEMLHPEHDAIQSEEKYKLMDDKGFIVDNIDKIDEYYQGCMKKGSVAQFQGLTEQEILENAVKKAKVEKYFDLLHPKYNAANPWEKKQIMNDMAFLIYNIDEIHNYCQGSMKKGSVAQFQGLTEQEIVNNAFKKAKVEKYFELLYPEYNTAKTRKKAEMMDDKRFIAEHIDEIDTYYQDCMQKGSVAQFKGQTEQEILANALRKAKIGSKITKVEKYFELLHPEYDKVGEKRKAELIDDKGFIAEHIDKIDTYYQDCMQKGSVAQLQGLTEQEIIGSAFKKAKIEKYFNLLHPKYNTANLEEKKQVTSDIEFIASNIDEIDAYYQGCMKKGSIAQCKRLTEQEIIGNALKKAKVCKYFNLLTQKKDLSNPEKKNQLINQMEFITENIDEIDNYYQACMQKGSVAQCKGLTEKEIIGDAVKKAKVGKYFKLLYPKYNSLDSEKKNQLINDIEFMADHIDEIDNYYQGCMKKGSVAQFQRLTEQEIIGDAVKKAKVGKYFDLLHPKYNSLDLQKKNQLISDVGFIVDHIDEIDNYYQGCMKKGSVAQFQGLTEQEIVANALKTVRVGKYFDLLYPKYNSLDSEKKNQLVYDIQFMAKYIDEIDTYYQNCIKEGSVAQFQRLTEQEIMGNALTKVKVEKYFEILHPECDTLEAMKKTELRNDLKFITKNINQIDKIYKENEVKNNEMVDQQMLQEEIKRLSERITIQKIGQATINTPITAKKEVEQVENYKKQEMI